MADDDFCLLLYRCGPYVFSATATNIINSFMLSAMRSETVADTPAIVAQELAHQIDAHYNASQLPAVSLKFNTPAHISCFPKKCANMTGSSSYARIFRTISEFIWTYHEADICTVVPKGACVVSMSITARELCNPPLDIDFVALATHPRFGPFIQYSPDRIGMAVVKYSPLLAQVVFGAEEAARVCSTVIFKVAGWDGGEEEEEEEKEEPDPPSVSNGEAEPMVESMAEATIATTSLTATLMYKGLFYITGATPKNTHEAMLTIIAMLVEFITGEKHPVTSQPAREMWPGYLTATSAAPGP